MLIRAYNHTSDKYGDKGYAKHYVVDDEYNEFRNEISNLLSDRNLFNAKYLKTNNLI